MPLMRVDAGLILLYAFDEGSGSTVADQSGVLPEHDLIVADPGNVTWSANHLTIDAATALSTAGAATKVATRAVATGELTVEAWIKPDELHPDGSRADPQHVRRTPGLPKLSCLARRHEHVRGPIPGRRASRTGPTAAQRCSRQPARPRPALTHVVHTHRFRRCGGALRRRRREPDVHAHGWN